MNSSCRCRCDVIANNIRCATNKMFFFFLFFRLPLVVTTYFACQLTILRNERINNWIKEEKRLIGRWVCDIFSMLNKSKPQNGYTRVLCNHRSPAITTTAKTILIFTARKTESFAYCIQIVRKRCWWPEPNYMYGNERTTKTNPFYRTILRTTHAQLFHYRHRLLCGSSINFRSFCSLWKRKTWVHTPQIGKRTKDGQKKTKISR